MRTFGHIAGYPPGSTFENRKHLAAAGVHRPQQAGISGSQSVGADSIVLSGGYEDDEDHGRMVIYTGAGGRDPDSGAQTAHQLLVRTNLALARNKLEGLPVRVIRGATHSSPYSPDHGYRYDELYYVSDFWREQGAAGFYVWRFMLIMKEGEGLSHVHFEDVLPARPERVLSLQQRIVRSTLVARGVKDLHRYQCQVCALVIETQAGPYAEAAHIQPLGRPHNGPDIPENILCLCPNHHTMFDNGVFMIADDLKLLGLNGRLRITPGHTLDPAFIRYHREHYSDNFGKLYVH